MNSVFHEIEMLREGKPIDEILEGSNRFAIFCRESDRTRTAYCFSVPIRNVKRNHTVDLRFDHFKNRSSFLGSNSEITVNHATIRLANQFGQCEILLPGDILMKTEDAIYLADDATKIKVSPTLNGLMFVMECKKQITPRLVFRLDREFESSKTNERYFSVMRETLVPFVTISCIGTLDDSGKVIRPCQVQNQKTGKAEYVLTFLLDGSTSKRFAVEINLQDTKLFQDTTVESLHPNLNNVFGGIAFLGKGVDFGEQWLYTRLEITNLPQLQNKKILKSVLHLPQLGRAATPLIANFLSARFCSFGSNWQNKVEVSDIIAESTSSKGYYHFDLTKLLGNLREKSKNFVLRGKSLKSPVIIPTGDCFFAPQILEVKYQ